MFDTKSPVIKITGYIIIGFFCVIIMIMFGMPSFMGEMTKDINTVATINGEKLQRTDFFRFRESRYGRGGEERDIDQTLNEYVQYRLIVQKAKKMGLTPSDDRVTKSLKENPYLKNPDTGKFDSQRLERYLEGSYLTHDKFYWLQKNDMILQDLRDYIMMGTAVPREDVLFQYKCDNSKIRIQYAYLSGSEIEKRFGNSVTVTEEEIAKEMQKNKAEVKDPKTDKERIRKKLVDRKVNEQKKALVDKINEIAIGGGTFAQTSALLQGQVTLSAQFKIGETVKEDKKDGKPLTSLSSSRIFMDQLLSLDPGKSSKAVETATGVYLFTPTQKEFPDKMPDDKVLQQERRKIEYGAINGIYSSMMQQLYEKSKIIKPSLAEKPEKKEK